MSSKSRYDDRTDSWLTKVGVALLYLVRSIDWPLLVIVILIAAVGFVALYSAGYTFPWRIEAQIRNIGFAALIMLIVANLPLKWIRSLSLPVYVIGLLLLIVTIFSGVSIKGATRWLSIGGFQLQPSEVMKLATPMLLAWYFQIREETIKWWDYCFAFLIMLIPTALILRQPDLGTAALVFCVGFAVIFFAGMNWKFFVGLVVVAMTCTPIIWMNMYDYQKQRVLTLFDPESDPLGAGFHVLQSVIAVGSGGIAGKGWMNGTQAHLDFIPERTSDFLFAVFAEEFGLVGEIGLILLYTALILRTIYIACTARSQYERLLAGAIACVFLVYSFVNMGMVSGILPVVGVPLPFMSYGGSALVVLGICCGLLMKISADRRG